MSKPVLFLVHDDSSTLEALEADVRRRFAADYTVLTGASSEAATSALAELGSRGDEVALIVAPELDGVGGARLEAITLRDGAADTRETVPAAALFVMIGSEPNTDWLRETLAQDDRGFLLTGHDLQRSGQAAVPPSTMRPACPVASPPATFDTHRPSGSPRPSAPVPL